MNQALNDSQSEQIEQRMNQATNEPSKAADKSQRERIKQRRMSQAATKSRASELKRESVKREQVSSE